MRIRGILQRWKDGRSFVVAPGAAAPLDETLESVSAMQVHRPVTKKRFVMAGLDPAVSAVHAKRGCGPRDPA